MLSILTWWLSIPINYGGWLKNCKNSVWTFYSCIFTFIQQWIFNHRELMGYRMAWLVKIYYLDFTEIRLIRICYLDFIKFDWDFVSLVSLCCNLHVVCMYFIFWIALYEIFYLDNYYEINIAYLRHDLVLVNLLCVICESRRVIYMDVWPKFYFFFFFIKPQFFPKSPPKNPNSRPAYITWSNWSMV